MKELFPVNPPEFFTATIYDWQHALKDDIHKNIIIKTLQFMVSDKRIELNAFAIMSNHIHLIWQPLSGFTPSDNQATFMKYTAGKIRASLLKTNEGLLTFLKVNKYDREYQIWKREPFGVDLHTAYLFIQKLQYIHNNPVSAGLCSTPEEYHYSSAKFYSEGIDDFGMLTHYSGN